MKHRNLVVATVLCLSLALFTACAGGNDSKEKVTETNHKETESTNGGSDEPITTNKNELAENQTTTSKVEPETVTREDIVAAAMKLADVEDEMDHPFSSVTNARLGLCDVTLDGVPELFILATQIWGNVDGSIYKYENGEYKYYKLTYAVGQGSRLYKDKNGNTMILELETNLGEDETGQVIFHNTHYIFDIGSKTRTKIQSTMSSAEEDMHKRVFYVNGQEMTSEEYLNSIYSQLGEYTLVGEMMELMGIDYCYDEEGLNRAYDEYLAGKK